MTSISPSSPLVLQRMSLNGLLKECEAEFKEFLGPTINLRYSLTAGIPDIDGDREQLRQLLSIFLSNAKKAMPYGGQLLLQTQDVPPPDTEPFSSDPFSSYVILSISDSGKGISPEYQAKIQQLFLDKHPPIGVLPGLTNAKTILDAHQARLLFYSQVIRGTSFKIYFPIQKKELHPLPATGPSKGTETLLFVEDDRMIRHIYTKFLRQRGYNVLEAQHGKEAFDVYERYTGHIHLMITDVVMPELNGRQLVELVTSRHPHLKVLYISGFTKDAILQRGILKADVPFLEKPFGREELALRIRQLLDIPSVPS
jgi:two-component system, cell cycle sensor histidine kinase and response regulator CckA